MKIRNLGVHFKRKNDFTIDRSDSVHHVFQLFHTPTEFTINNTNIAMPKNTVIFLKKSFPHKFKSLADNMENSFLVFELSEEEEAQITEIPYNTPILLPESSVRYYEKVFDLLMHHYSKKGEHVSNFHLLMALLYQLQADAQTQSIVYTDPLIYTLEQLNHEINVHVRRDWTVAEMAKLCCMSPSYFRHQFKARFRISPVRFLIDSRIAISKVMLTGTNSSMHTIADNCGFKSYEYYVRQFKQRTGMTPTEFRNKNR